MLIRYFAWLKDHTGCAAEEMILPEDVQTVAALIDNLSARSDAYRLVFADRDVVRVAVNQKFAGHDVSISDADEVAFFPPVTGG